MPSTVLGAEDTELKDTGLMGRPHRGPDVTVPPPEKPECSAGPQLPTGALTTSPIWNLEALPPSGLRMTTVPGSQAILEAGCPPGCGQTPELCTWEIS